MIINRAARGKYRLAAPHLDPDGRIPLTGFHAAREVGHRVNALRNTVDDPDQILKASELYSLTLLDRLYRSLLTSFLKEGAALSLEEHRAALEAQAGPGSADELADALIEEFPPEDPSRRSRAEGVADLLLLRLANENPASKAVRELIDDGGLHGCRAWEPALRTAETLFTSPPEAEGGSLAAMLRRPFQLHPDSLQSQLGYIRDNWGTLIQDELLPLLGALDFLNEESRPWFGPGPGEQHPYTFSDGDYEGFSTDRAWMPLTVMMAKNVLVWLDQLSLASSRPLKRLDEIPEAEFERLARRGFTALWLIGMWRRSQASKRIKELCGNSGAEASAYSLTGYEISPELGGEEALEALRIRAGRHGIRLASDMVPNHTGIDADWIYEHPDYYLQTQGSPYPSYSFSGENLSAREGFETYLEDHYLDKSDAAVVFKHVERASSQVRYIYHGNDGTHMPWNDTAQLNYLNPELREEIIRRIVEVAKQFPIVRFDAAMTLAKEHIRRLWFPEPGKGGSVPSRAEHALSDEHFQQLLPKEFWREVVDRTAVEAPDTLLLAEAFWMMEGYFVRTLGMHRVYNSAFMNMLKNEENEKYRQTLKNTLEFDPQILKRFVNFMNNPDEETAVAQFGSGDKYFGICTMLATMPGLPMFGHGQIEGFSEKYGMEYSRALLAERPDSALISRHEEEIFPLLKRRALFAEAEEFTLFDFYGPDGINHNVFVYSNRREDERALVLYNNSLESASGRIHLSSPYRERKQEQGVRRRSLGEALSVPDNPRSWLVLRQNGSDREFIRNCREVARNGLSAELPGYGCQVFLDLRIVVDDDEGRYRQVAERLQGAGCAGVEREIRLMHMQPLHAALSSALRPEVIEVFRSAMFRQQSPPAGFLPAWERDYHRFLSAAAEQSAVSLNEVRQVEESMLTTAGTVLRMATEELGPDTDEERLAGYPGYLQRGLEMRTEAPAVFAAWCCTERMGEAFGDSGGGALSSSLSRSLIDEWHLATALRDIFTGSGLKPGKADYGVSLVKLLTAERDWHRGLEPGTADSFLRRLLHQEEIQRFLEINRYNDILWFSKDRFEDLLWWFFCIAAVSLEERGGSEADSRLKVLFGIVHRWLELEERSGYRVADLTALLDGVQNGGS